MDETLLFTPKPNTHHQTRRSKTRDFRNKYKGRKYRTLFKKLASNGKVYYNDIGKYTIFYGKSSRKAQRERLEYIYSD